MNLCCQKVHIFQQKEEEDILPRLTLLKRKGGNGGGRNLDGKATKMSACIINTA